VKRVGADELFAPWKDNANRQLLWHVRACHAAPRSRTSARRCLTSARARVISGSHRVRA
jgi:hypothetical protein